MIRSRRIEITMSIGAQVVWLFLLAIPIASIAWTVTHEEIFQEVREYCRRRSEQARNIAVRKFFYIPTCEYCFSHYVAAFFIGITGYQLLYSDWRGYLIAFFALPFVANAYIGLFGKVKLGVKKERAEIKAIETEVEEAEDRPKLDKPAA